MEVGRVKCIFVYPIKSCRGISVPQAPISSTGFRFDRQWVVVNSKGRACTQRVEPKLALVQVQLPNEAFSVDPWEPNHNYSYLVIKAPGMQELKVPLNKAHEKLDGVSVWEWSGSAVDQGPSAAQWFSDYLGKPSRLVRFNDASEGSLNALNALLKEPVPVNRFRPNILVDGCEPFDEDLWTEIKINNTTFQGVKLCSRCKVPTINQENGIAGSEPTETMLSFRSDKALRPNKKQQKGMVYFGQHLVCMDSLSKGNRKSIKVGDPICVLKKVASADAAAA